MIEALASPTLIVETELFSADDLEKAALFLGVGPAADTGAEKPLLFIVDPRPLPVRDRVLGELALRRKIVVLDRIVPDPKSVDINFMAKEARDLDPAMLIGIGGGSTLDSAKAVTMLLVNSGVLDEYLGPNAVRQVSLKGVPLLLIPTTAGTGSEVTRFGVYTSESGNKYTLASPLLRADAALLCSELVAELPPRLVAAAGYDALTHALETLWNKNASPVSDALATEAAAAILLNLLPAYEEASKTNAAVNKAPSPFRSALLKAANKAGIAFDKTGTAAIHALSFILSEEWQLPHGTACAFFTDSVFKMNSADKTIVAKLANLARKLRALKGQFEGSLRSDEQASAALGAYLSELRSKLALPNRFNEVTGFADSPYASDSKALCQRFQKALQDPKMKNNYIAVDEGMLNTIIESQLP